MCSRLAAAAVALVTGWTVAPVAQPQFRGRTDFVLVPAVVVDKRDQDLTRLNLEDFEVYEDGRRVVVETFVPPNDGESEAGRFVVVIVDNLHTPAEIWWRAKRIAHSIVARMGPKDVASVIPVSGGIATPSSSPALLAQAIERVHLSAASEVLEAGQRASYGLRAIADVGEQVSSVQHRRKVLVVIGPAQIYGPNEPSAFADREPDVSPWWMDTIRRTGLENVAVYVIDPTGFTGHAEDYSRSFAAATGGVSWSNTNRIEQAVDRLWKDAGTYYLLGYRAPVTDGKAHAIDVRVRVPGAKVRARRLRG